MAKSITIFLADDHTVVRAGLRALLESDEEISVVGEAENGHVAFESIMKLKPDIAILDISMPEMTGIEAALGLKKNNVKTKILFLSMYTDDEYVVSAINAGAHGYIVKQSASSSLVDAVKHVKSGRVYFSPEISNAVVSLQNEKGQIRVTRSEDVLTHRELGVLKLLAEGLKNKEISERLFISTKTVEKHRENIRRKLGINDVAGLTRYAIEKEIV